MSDVIPSRGSSHLVCHSYLRASCSASYPALNPFPRAKIDCLFHAPVLFSSPARPLINKLNPHLFPDRRGSLVKARILLVAASSSALSSSSGALLMSKTSRLNPRGWHPAARDVFSIYCRDECKASRSRGMKETKKMRMWSRQAFETKGSFSSLLCPFRSVWHRESLENRPISCWSRSETSKEKKKRKSL